jgi:hypothetical protein
MSLSSVVADANYARSSDGAGSFAQTPPTSDPIDVDMLSAEDEVKVKSKTKANVSESVIDRDLGTHILLLYTSKG